MSADLPTDATTFTRVATAEQAGQRLDRFLAARFLDRSRTWFAAGLRDGRVATPDGATLRALPYCAAASGTRPMLSRHRP
jgi:hypothetical protein